MNLQTCRRSAGVALLCFFLLLCGSASMGQEHQAETHKKDSLPFVRDPLLCCCDDDATIMCYSSDKHQMVHPTEILYDFKTKNIAFPRNAHRLGRSDAVRIRVSHFNPFLYQVVIDGRDSSAHSVVDNNNLLSAFMSLSNLSSLVAGLNSTVSAGAIAKAAEPLTRGLQLQFFTSPIKSNDKKPKPRQPSPDEKKCFAKLDNLFGQQTDVIDNLNDGVNNLKTDMTENLLAWDALFAPQRHIYPDCNEFAALRESGPRLKNLFRNLKDDIGELYKDVIHAQRSYLDSVTDCAATIKQEGNDRFRVRDSLIKTYYALTLTNLGAIDSVINYKLLLPLEQSIDRMQGVTPCYTSAPIFFLGDSRVFSLAFKPLRDSLPAYGPMVFELPWTQQRIWGISGGFYTAYMPSQHYTGQKAIGDTLFRLVKDNTGNVEVGINALAYVAWKLSPENPKNYNYLGASIGAAMSINATPKPRLLLAATYAYGRTNRLLVSLGLIMGYTDKLSNAYNLTDRFSASSGYTNNVLRAGPFFSLNYSFLN